MKRHVAMKVILDCTSVGDVLRAIRDFASG
jgi:hypothetical protein